MGADDHKTTKPTNWDDIVGDESVLEADGGEELDEIPFDPDPIEPYERFYQLWMAPSCESDRPSEHRPTFLFVRAMNADEAAFKAGIVAGMTRGVQCPCQVDIREVEVYV